MRIIWASVSDARPGPSEAPLTSACARTLVRNSQAMGALMERKVLPSVSSAFARFAWRTVVILLIFAFGVFGFATHRLVKSHEEQHLSSQTLLCASMIRSADPSEFRRVASALQVHSRGFVAIAVLDESDELSGVFPETPRHRAAVIATLDPASADARPVSMATGRRKSMMAIPMPMQESCLSQKRVFAIFDADSHVRGLVALLVFFGAFVGAVAVGAFFALRHWFERHVADPLRSFGSVAPIAEGAEAPVISGGRMMETARLAQILRDFVNTLAETDARARKAKEETIREFRDREAGFDRQLRRVRDQATTDPLTKLRNRGYLDEMLPTVFAAHRTGGTPLAAVMLDLDNFKLYNDLHGHQAGDALLRFVGALLRGSIRPTDHAIRYGGDEFLLLLPETSAEQASIIAGRVVKLFGQYSSCLQQEHRLSISAGIASVPDDACSDGLELVARADHALYAAKYRGKNTIVTSDESGPRRAFCSIEQDKSPLASIPSP